MVVTNVTWSRINLQEFNAAPKTTDPLKNLFKSIYTMDLQVMKLLNLIHQKNYLHMIKTIEKKII